MPTVGQVKRALAWEQYLRRPRLKRAKKDIPRCVSCGKESDREFARGEPGFGCGPHEPFRLTLEQLERARRELGR